MPIMRFRLNIATMRFTHIKHSFLLPLPLLFSLLLPLPQPPIIETSQLNDQTRSHFCRTIEGQTPQSLFRHPLSHISTLPRHGLTMASQRPQSARTINFSPSADISQVLPPSFRAYPFRAPSNTDPRFPSPRGRPCPKGSRPTASSSPHTKCRYWLGC